MSTFLEVNSQGALHAVSQAIRLDADNNIREAYMQYLHCISFIAQTLLKDATELKEGYTSSRKKYITLGQKCIDRLGALVDKVEGTTGQPSERSKMPPPPELTVSNDDIPSPAISPVMSLPTERPKPPSPMEIARRQNQQLMAAYKTRLARMSAGKSLSSSMALSLQRKLAENTALGKMRQEALDKKMRERQLILQEQAERRFASTSGISKEDQERKKIYTKILEYETENKWTEQWRTRLKENPTDERFIDELITKVLRSNDHPLAQLMRKNQYDIYNQIFPLVEKYVDNAKVPYTNCAICAASNSQPDLDTTGQSDTSIGAEDRNQSSSSLVSSDAESRDIGDDFAEKYDQSKRNLGAAIVKGERLKRQLSQRNEASMAILAGGVGNLPHFNIEDMDYLFNSDDDKDDDDDIDVNTQEKPPEQKINVPRQEEQEAMDRHLANIVKDVKVCLEKLYSMFVVTYEQLNSPAGKDQCYASVEEPFFKPLWGCLLALFRCRNRSQELKLACLLTSQSDTLPGVIGVKDKYCLQDQDGIPYLRAIEELQRLITLVSPLSKLESLVHVSKLVCQCIEDYSVKTGNESITSSGIGADDLLPILSYIVIRSGLPSLISECQAMEEFIHEGYLMGEEGYCLTTLQTALNYVETLHN